RWVTSVTASVNELSHEPKPPITFGFCATRRCAAFFAFSAESPVSRVMSFTLAPPSDLMPPELLMSSIAISAPMRTSSPWRAHGPESGTITAISTSFCCAAAGPGAASAAANASAGKVSQGLCIASSKLCYCLHPEIHASDAVVRQERVVGSFQHHAAGFENIAEIAGLYRLGDPLLHQQNGQSVAVQFLDPLENQIGDKRCEPHRGFVEHQQARRGGDAA